MTMEEPDWEWEVRLNEVRQKLDEWRERIKVPEDVNSGSSLAADDRTHPEMPSSQLAWWGLLVGVEHLDGTLGLMDHQLDRNQPILPAATYTVLRGALIGSSQAALLLCTAMRKTRVNYGLRIALEEYQQALKFRRITVEHEAVWKTELTVPERNDYLGWLEKGKERVERLLQQQDVPTQKLSDTDIITKAAKVVHRGEDAELLHLAMEMEWRLGSGSAHGRLLMNMQRPHGHRQDENGRNGYFGTTKKAVTQQIATVWMILNEAWRMWDLRRSPPF